VLLEGKARVPSNLRFVVALAPQLVTLRLDNGPARGIPISFIKYLITIGHRLQRLDSSIISDYRVTSSPFPPPFVVADLPPLELRFIFNSWRSNHMLVTDPVTPQRRLWALFESRDAGAVAAISTLRRVGRVVLEPWLAERFPEGVDYAVERIREKGLELKFDRPDGFYDR